MYILSKAQQLNDQESLPATLDQQVAQLPRLRQAFYSAGPDKHISSNENLRVDEWKRAFQTRYGYFEYQVIPFNLLNTPASFQGYVHKILAEKLDVFVIVYLNNILIYTKNAGQSHVKAVR